ncbi:MAG: GHMP kinase [Chloroflexi bacterium]|nr:GHMP kinase [Chloroflexota bacterium]MCY4111589.1 GHMP kinase [Chloroflexota bacterium]
MTSSLCADPAEGVVARGVAWAPGTCGELAQGELDGTTVMVTCPIDMGSTATVEVSDGAGCVDGPANAPKARRAVALALEFLGHRDLDARLSLERSLPRAKGMASSTADVAATIGATAAALGAAVSPRQQADLALYVEPSDGVMLPGIALFDHRGGRVARSLGDPPPMRVLALEFADEVDTEAFNAVDRRAELRSHASRFRDALNLITAGLADGDAKLVGEGATLSSLANQAVLPKPQLATVLELAQAAGAVGVNVAHSGTVLGLLFADDADRIGWAAHHARTRLPGLVAVHDRRVVGGGVVAGGSGAARR